VSGSEATDPPTGAFGQVTGETGGGTKTSGRSTSPDPPVAPPALPMSELPPPPVPSPLADPTDSEPPPAIEGSIVLDPPLLVVVAAWVDPPAPSDPACPTRGIEEGSSTLQPQAQTINATDAHFLVMSISRFHFTSAGGGVGGILKTSHAGVWFDSSSGWFQRRTAPYVLISVDPAATETAVMCSWGR